VIPQVVASERGAAQTFNLSGLKGLRTGITKGKYSRSRLESRHHRGWQTRRRSMDQSSRNPKYHETRGISWEVGRPTSQG